ncbi:retrovirus-related pol polyprotein from transposon TNT 1-94 [Tanacetum coccineum]
MVKGNLVRGLPSKLFENDQTCVACQKGKQHRASCKSKTKNSISLLLHLLHVDLFGPTFVKALWKKMYCLVVTDDYSRFTWVFFLATKYETSSILKSFITEIENLVDHKVKVIRYDNGTEFKNSEMNQFCEMKVKPLGVFNSRTRIVEENLHIRFSESTPNVVGSGPDWLFDIDALTRTMNYEAPPYNFFADPKSSHDDGSKPSSDDGKKVDKDPRKENHPLDQVIGDLQSATQTRKMSKNLEEHGFRTKKVIHALKDPRWIEAMQKELLQFLLTEVWTLSGVYQMGNTRDYRHLNGVFKNKKDEKGIVIRNMQDGCSGIKEEVYVCQPPGFKDPDFPDRVYKVEKALLQVKQKNDDIFISQDKYVEEILKKFGFTEVKTASTSMETQKPLLKDEDGQPKLGLWYPKDSYFDLVAYADSDYARASLDMKSTTGLFWSTVKAKTINGEVQLHALVDGKKIIVTEASVRRDLQLEDKEDEAVHKELGDSLVRAATTASSLKADSNYCNTLQSDEDRIKLEELMTLCTTLQTKVLDLEKTKTTQQNEIDSLKRRIKKLEKKRSSKTHKLKRLYKVGLTARVESFDDEESLGEDASKQGRIDAIDVDDDITLVSVVGDKVSDVDDATTVSTATTTIATIVDEITLAKVLEEPVKPMKKKDQISFDKETALRLQAEFDEEERLAREKAEKEKEANTAFD